MIVITIRIVCVCVVVVVVVVVVIVFIGIKRYRFHVVAVLNCQFHSNNSTHYKALQSHDMFEPLQSTLYLGS